MPRIPDHPHVGKDVSIELDGHTLPAREGESVACALLAAGETVFSRSVKYHRPRGPYCMAAACSHCLMRVDGVPNMHTCRTPVRAGMRLERQNAYPSVEHDVFGAIDWLFPHGMDHHAMFAGVPVAEQVMAKVARHLAGLGLLPDKLATPPLPPQTLHVKVAIAGAGPAGLAAARELERLKVPHLLLEREHRVGGRWLTGAIGPKDPPLSAFTPLPPDRLRAGTTLLGLFEDEGGRFVAGVERAAGPSGPARLLKVYAERFLVATGGYPAMWPFENNELPGVFAGRAISRLLLEDGYLPGENFALIGTGPELYDLHRLLQSRGATITALVDVAEDPPPGSPSTALRGEVLKAHGRTRIRRVTWRSADGRRHRTPCDALAVCIPVSPAFELARQGGAEVVFSPAHLGFVVQADDDGRTQAPSLYVAGDLLGASTISRAADSGARAARAIAASLQAGAVP